MARSNPDFQNGVPEMLILKLLDRREMYGYELVREIQTTSGESLRYGEGSVYPVLHALEARKLVKTRHDQVSGRVRTYYKPTAAGRKRLAELVAEFERTVGAVRLVLGGAGAGG
ncbi:MAG: PadR family transcriptional regulator [Bryobacteraceae bacterium]